MKRKERILVILLLTISLLLISMMLNSYTYATPTQVTRETDTGGGGGTGSSSSAGTVGTDEYKNIYKNNNSGLMTIGGKILYIAQMIGYAVSVIMLIIIGITYVTKSPDQKAQVKDRLVTYTIGAAILFGATTLVSLVANFGNGIFK